MNRYHTYCVENLERHRNQNQKSNQDQIKTENYDSEDDDLLRMVHMTKELSEGKDILTNYLGRHTMAYIEHNQIHIHGKAYSTVDSGVTELLSFYGIKDTSARREALRELLACALLGSE